MIELDGSYGEGGGQMLRTALSLSLITGKAFRIINIRKGRDEPGLKNQHLSCIKACAEFCNAAVDGAKVGSDSVEFVPRQLKNRQMDVNIGTAGSSMLLLQSILLPMMFTDSEIKITGGTDVVWSITYDYFRNIILPIVNDYTKFELYCEKRGYYPKGGGQVIIKNKPKFKLLDFDTFKQFHQYIFANPPIDLSKNGKLICIKGISHASKDLQHAEVAERQAKDARLMLGRVAATDIETEYSNTESTGSGIMLYGIFKKPINLNQNNRNANMSNAKGDMEKQYRVGADVLGERSVKAEEIGRRCAEKLLKTIKTHTCADEHLQDNIIPLLGLFGGAIRVGKITDHTKSNIHVCEKFLDVSYAIEEIKINSGSDKESDKNSVKNNFNNSAEDYNEANLISVFNSSKS